MTTAVLYFSLLLARVAAFVSALPLLGGSSVPRLVRATLVLVLTVFWFGSIVPGLPADALTQPAQTPWLFLAIALGREAILGLLLGFAFGLVLVPARVAGEYITEEMGLTLGSLVSAAGTAPTGPLTQLFEMIAMLLFFGLDGHHVFFSLLHSTLSQYPLGQGVPQLPPLQQVTAMTALTQEWGLLLAAPVACVLFLTTILLALLMKAAPQLSLYSVGFPLRLGAGLGAIILFLPNLLANLASIFGRLQELLLRLI